MALDALLRWELVLAAFAGGAFGAAVGALQSFALAGLVVVLGETQALLARALGGTPAVDLTGDVAFGVVLGPHVAFGGGAAAVAYAAQRGTRNDLDASFDYHGAKHITRGLGARLDVLAVGGTFGVLGHLVATASGSLGVPTDPVALGVVASALAHRVAFGYSVVGDAVGGVLDMSPFERGVLRTGNPQADGGHPDDDPRPGEARDDGLDADEDRIDGDPDPDGGRLAVEPWLPYQYRWSHVATLGLLVGALGGYLAVLTGSAFLGFGLSAVALAFLCAGVEGIPVTHHVTLPASTAVLAAADAPGGTVLPGVVSQAVPLGEALLLGTGFGLVGALVGELAQRVFYAHAETHLDPPAASIVVTSFLIAGLAMAGVLPSAAWIPLP